MNRVPPGFRSCLEEIREALVGVEGWLSDREADFLALLAACPTAQGGILEIGSFRGRSAIVLAKAVRLSDRAEIHTVDICRHDQLTHNLRRAGVTDRVRVYWQPSNDVLAAWPRSLPLRLVWHDGANTFEQTCCDVDQFQPFLADGAIVAFHDVLNTSGERMLAYAERVLGNCHFGAAGVCGSIGWAQYRVDPAAAAVHQRRKQALVRRLARLRPFHTLAPLSWPRRAHYRLLRSLVPHGRVDPDAWTRQVA